VSNSNTLSIRFSHDACVSVALTGGDDDDDDEGGVQNRDGAGFPMTLGANGELQLLSAPRAVAKIDISYARVAKKVLWRW
jgi:hypothetical protein